MHAAKHSQPASPQRRWEHFPHEADIGVRGIGRTLEEAFEQAGLALMHVVCDPTQVRPAQRFEFHCTAPDAEVLLVDWLNALIYEMATCRVLFGAFEVRIDGNALEGRAYGEPVDAHRHESGVEVKGATFTCLSVRRDPALGAWVAQCVVDV